MAATCVVVNATSSVDVKTLRSVLERLTTCAVVRVDRVVVVKPTT
jgi:hypothetical protein